jgi:hypothetical protein
MKRHKKKFTLKDLVTDREDLVSNVIDKSIDKYVNGVGLGSWDTIIATFDGAGMSLKSIADKYFSLDEMIQRRHQIVHESDLAAQTNELNQIDMDKIIDWIKTMPKFLVEVFEILINDVYRDEIAIRWEATGLIKNNQDIHEIKVCFSIQDHFYE